MRINNCTSPRAYSSLTVGTEYTFKVWAMDAAGNIDCHTGDAHVHPKWWYSSGSMCRWCG